MGRVIESKTWKTIEIIIMRYPEQKKKLDEMLEDIVYTSGSDSGKTNFDTESIHPQSVTEAKAFKLQNKYYKKIESNVKAVSTVYNSLNESERKVVATRYWNDPKRKIPYTQIDCGYSERQMKRIIFKMIYQVGLKTGEIENKYE